MIAVKMSYRSVLLLILVLISTVSLGFAKTDAPVLVLDRRNAPQLPQHFRSTLTSPVSSKPLNLKGLNTLHMAGGSQFAEMSLKKITEKLQLSKLVIIDLRQESHGFLNGNAISWYGSQDAANAGKSDSTIEEDQASRLTSLEKHPTAFVYRIVQKSPLGDIEKTQKIEFAVHHVSSEEQIVEKHHLSYYRLYIQDFHAPHTQQVNRFIELVKQLKPDDWVYFHCRAGVGRTTTFMAMYDMLHNAGQVSFKDILARQQALGGKDLATMPPRDSFKYKYAVERLAFLKKFYRYARSHQDMTWDAYLSENPDN